MHEHLFAQAYPLACRAARARIAVAVALRSVTPTDREDLEQEALLAVWRALQHFDASRGALRTFIEKVVASRLASVIRARRRQPTVELIQEDHSVGLDGIPVAEFRMDFQRVSDSLAEPDRRLAAVLLDHSPTEASRALDISRSTVYERIRGIRVVFEKAGFGPRVNHGR